MITAVSVRPLVVNAPENDTPLYEDQTRRFIGPADIKKGRAAEL